MGSKSVSLDFKPRIREFYTERSFLARQKPTVRQELLDQWQHDFVRHGFEPTVIEKLQKEMEIKTSRDGLLVTGFQLGDHVQLPNPLLYATTLCNIAERKRFLRGVFESLLLNNADGSEKNTTQTGLKTDNNNEYST